MPGRTSWLHGVAGHRRQLLALGAMDRRASLCMVLLQKVAPHIKPEMLPAAGHDVTMMPAEGEAGKLRCFLNHLTRCRKVDHDHE